MPNVIAELTTNARRIILAAWHSTLDLLWTQVNSLGGFVYDGDEYGRGFNEAIGIILGRIEKMGGMDPAKRKAAKLAE